VVIYLERGADDLHMVDATATPSSLASLNPRRFGLSDADLPGLSWKRNVFLSRKIAVAVYLETRKNRSHLDES